MGELIHISKFAEELEISEGLVMVWVNIGLLNPMKVNSKGAYFCEHQLELVKGNMVYL